MTIPSSCHLGLLFAYANVTMSAGIAHVFIPRPSAGRLRWNTVIEADVELECAPKMAFSSVGLADP
jgi:hypothetical protein